MRLDTTSRWRGESLVALNTAAFPASRSTARSGRRPVPRSPHGTGTPAGEGTYFQLGPGRDRRLAVRAYEALLALDPTETAAANNLANILGGRREFVRAESLYKSQIDAGRETAQQYQNLIPVLFNLGKIQEAEQVTATYSQRYATALFAQTAPANFPYQRGQLDSLERYLKALTTNASPIVKVNVRRACQLFAHAWPARRPPAQWIAGASHRQTLGHRRIPSSIRCSSRI